NDMTWCESAPATCKVPETGTEVEPPNVTAPTIVASNDRVLAILDRKASTTSTRGEGCADGRADGVTEAADVGAGLATGDDMTCEMLGLVFSDGAGPEAHAATTSADVRSDRAVREPRHRGRVRIGGAPSAISSRHVAARVPQGTRSAVGYYVGG